MGLLHGSGGDSPLNEADGLRLDNPAWEVGSPSTLVGLFEQLQCLLPAGAILYFECAPFDDDTREFLASSAVQEHVRICAGTLWPHPEWFHVPATPENLSALSEFVRGRNKYSLGNHIHAYLETHVLMQWHDIFELPILLSDRFSEDQASSFSSGLGTYYTYYRPVTD